MNNALLLECLFEVGVDKWDGYEQAIAIYHQREEEMENYNQTTGDWIEVCPGSMIDSGVEG